MYGTVRIDVRQSRFVANAGGCAYGARCVADAGCRSRIWRHRAIFGYHRGIAAGSRVTRIHRCSTIGDATMELAQQLLAKKRDFLVPCVYHFYQRPPVLVRGEGAYLFDAEGRRYLDCFSGVAVMNAGHCNPEIVEAAVEQLRTLQHTTTVYLTEPMLDLARAIAEVAPPGLKRSFFCASGSEANEGALLLATLATGRQEFAYLGEALHGRTKAVMSVTGLDMWRTDPYPLATAHRLPGPHDSESLPALER